MARIATPLTKKEIEQEIAKDNPKDLYDINGLMLRFRLNSSPCWLMTYQRPVIKTRTKISIGMYNLITLEEAREKCVKYKSLLRDGVDPQDVRSAEKLVTDQNTRLLSSNLRCDKFLNESLLANGDRFFVFCDLMLAFKKFTLLHDDDPKYVNAALFLAAESMKELEIK